MCYKKPGPRCSPHAYAAMDYARERVQVYRERLDDPAFSSSRYSDTQKRLAYAEQHLRRRSAEFAVTPEGLRLLAHRYRDHPEGEKMYAAAKKERLDALALDNEVRREEYRQKRLHLDEDSDAGDIGLDAPARGRKSNFKPQTEWDERYTYRQMLKGKSTQELHDLAAGVLAGRVPADPHLLTCIVNKRFSNLQTVRMIARSCSNFEVAERARTVLATRLLQVKKIPKHLEPKPLSPESEIVEPRTDEVTYERALHSTLLRVSEQENYRNVDRSDMEARIGMALQRERDAMALGTSTVEEVVLAQ